MPKLKLTSNQRKAIGRHYEKFGDLKLTAEKYGVTRAYVWQLAHKYKKPARGVLVDSWSPLAELNWDHYR